jgi:hypothetical protein
MEYVKPYNDFSNKQSKYIRPEMFWNANAKCIRIGEHYVFIEQNLVLEQKDLTSDKVLEFMGIDIDVDSLMPKTASDWVHLGVDGASAIASAFPGIGTAVSFIIDMIHSVSYFIEADYEEDQSKRYGLYVGGVITGIMGITTLPAIKNIFGSLLKGFVKGSIGTFFKRILKISNIPFKLLSEFIKMCFNLPFLKKGFYNFIVKNESSATFKLFAKVPMFKKVVDFVKTKIGKSLTNASEILVKDLDTYKIGVRTELPKMYGKMYDQMDRSIRKTIDKKTFVRLNMENAEKSYIKPLTKDAIASGVNTLKVGNDIFSKEAIAAATTAHAKQAMVRVQREMAQELAAKPWMKAVKTNLAKEAVERAMNMTVKNKAIPYEKIAKKIIAKVPEASLRKLPLNILKPLIKAGFIAGKEVAQTATQQAVNHALKSDSDDNNTSSNRDNTERADSTKSTSSDSDSSSVMNGQNSKTDYSSLKERYSLKVGSVDSVSVIGEISLVFQTPERSREEDDNSGTLFLEETSIFNQKNLTESMTDYDTMDELLDDLKMVGIKGEDKDTLREREMNKWQRTTTLSTPFIESKDARFEFYFMIRERAKVSLFKKNHVENINLSNMLSKINNIGYAEINGSMYLIIKKSKNSDNE